MDGRVQRQVRPASVSGGRDDAEVDASRGCLQSVEVAHREGYQIPAPLGFTVTLVTTARATRYLLLLIHISAEKLGLFCKSLER